MSSYAGVTAIHRRVEALRAGREPTLIARMSSGWAVFGERQFLRGYALLLPDPVVPTLNDLPSPARERFLSDMGRLGDALLATTDACRVNYALFGNLEPALHAHVVPRYRDERGFQIAEKSVIDTTRAGRRQQRIAKTSHVR